MTTATKQPRYRQIALDIAENIAHNQIKVGDKIHARSKLATKYGVSAETAHRAINVLADMGIVQSQHGTGATIISQEKAIDFIEVEQASSNLKTIKNDMVDTIAVQQQELDRLSNLLKTFLEKTQNYQQAGPLLPFELPLNEDSDKYGLSLHDLNFWHQTGVTLIGIDHDDKLIISPGPYMTFEKGDTIYFVGPEDSVAKVSQFLFNH